MIAYGTILRRDEGTRDDILAMVVSRNEERGRGNGHPETKLLWLIEGGYLGASFGVIVPVTWDDAALMELVDV